jgi:hypothetical protein
MRSSVVTPVITLSDDYKEDHGSRKRKEKKKKKGKKKKRWRKKEREIKNKNRGKENELYFSLFSKLYWSNRIK